MPRIAIRSIGVLPEGELSPLSRGVGTLLGAHPLRLDPLPDPQYAFDPRRRQYSSVEVLRALAASTPSGDSKIIGVTERDLFIPMLTFVFGQAQLGGRLAVVSLARLRQEFYGLPPDPALLINRAIKEMAHELGHTLGLAHCPDRLCAMSLSTGISQVDAKNARYCEVCATAAGLPQAHFSERHI